MGVRQSKRSVDISNTPKKGEVENGVEAEGGKMERLEEGDVATVKATLNGTAPHAEKEATSPVTEVSPMRTNELVCVCYVTFSPIVLYWCVWRRKTKAKTRISQISKLLLENICFISMLWN